MNLAGPYSLRLDNPQESSKPPSTEPYKKHRHCRDYCLLSSQYAAQGIEGFGMAAQRAAVESYAARAGLPIVAAYEEVETARRSNLRSRPQIVAAVRHARRSRALLVIARLDRLSRNVFVTLQLMESGVLRRLRCSICHA